MKLSKAMKAVDKQRDLKHPGKLKIRAKDSTAVVYVGETSKGKPTGCFYSGRRKKPNQYFSYLNTAQLHMGIKEFFKNQAERVAIKKESSPRQLKIGDVLYSSWGYDQTNIDYYQVTELVGKTMVVICEIAKEKSFDEQMSGHCSPIVSDFIGSPMRKKCDGKRVRINSYSSATLMEPRTVTKDGLKIYGTHSWSSWH